MPQVSDWRKPLDRWPFPLPDFRLDNTQTALVIIDMQRLDADPSTGVLRAYVQANPQLGGIYANRITDVIVPNIVRLLHFFRHNEMPVIHVVLESSATLTLRSVMEKVKSLVGDSASDHDPIDPSIIEELNPQQGERVIVKNTFGAFNSTDIDQTLRKDGIKNLVFVGISTSVCVETTARDAADRGYKCVVLEDATGEFETSYHEASLLIFARAFGRVLSTDEVLVELG